MYNTICSCWPPHGTCIVALAALIMATQAAKGAIVDLSAGQSAETEFSE